MKLTIEKVDNGYILTDHSDDDKKNIFEEAENLEKYALADLLRMVELKLGDYTSDYDQHRVFVFVLPGTNYTGPISNQMKDDMEWCGVLARISLEKEE